MSLDSHFLTLEFNHILLSYRTLMLVFYTKCTQGHTVPNPLSCIPHVALMKTQVYNKFLNVDNTTLHNNKNKNIVGHDLIWVPFLIT